jgi:hypothetical protein
LSVFAGTVICYFCTPFVALCTRLLLYHAWVVYGSTKNRRKVKRIGEKYKGKEESTKERRKVE